MCRWPLVIVELERKYLTVEKSRNFDTLVNQFVHDFPEQERACVIILVNDHVVNNVTDCPDLVVSDSVVNRRPVEVLLLII